MKRCKRKVDFCTMLNTVEIVKIPGRKGYKWPKLDEAYRILVDPDGFEGAHDALADVKACRKVFYNLKKEDTHNHNSLEKNSNTNYAFHSFNLYIRKLNKWMTQPTFQHLIPTSIRWS